MADIRINALATTAASTASDDFVAVDGSANGTRKLNAYSPTFGGNLTVSGTGASSVGGTLAVSNGGNAAQAAYVNTGSSTVGGYMLVGNAPNVQPERSAIIGQYAVLNSDHTMFGRNLVPVPNADTMKTLASVAYGAFLIRNNGAFEWLNNSTSTAGAAITPTSRMTLDTSGNLTVSGGALTLNNATESYVELKIAGTAKGYLDQLPTTLNVVGTSGVDVDVYAGGNNPANRVAKFASSNATTLYGNLTVSGTGTSSVAGNINFNGTGAATPPAGLNYGLFPQSGLGLGINSVSGGVGVWLAANGAFRLNSGTATNDYTGFEFTNATIGITGSSAYVRAIRTASSGSPTDLAFGIMASGTLAEAARFKSNGNLLLKGDGVDSSNGRLQLADHTTSAGGIGFGTDWTLSRDDATNFALYATGGASATFALYLGGVKRSSIGTDGTTTYIGSRGVGYSTILMSGNGSTALTLDSGQNATFARDIYSGTNGSVSGKLSIRNATTNAEGNIYGATSGGLRVDTGSNAYPIYLDGVRVQLSSPLRLGNAYVAGAPTATGYVTIQDSAGNTYKVLVGT